MPRPYIKLGSIKIAPFKNPTVEPYGPFTNTTSAWEYPVKQSIIIHEEQLNFNWPSAEHAFHGQKLIHLKSKLAATDPRQAVLTKTLHQLENTKNNPGDEFLPYSDYNMLIKNLIETNPTLYFGANQKEFDALCDASFHSVKAPKLGLMANGEPYLLEFMRLTLKMKFDQNPELKQLAIDCAHEEIIPIKISHLDNYWASGPEGAGQNRLGITILELGNHYLKTQGKKS
ncbi:MAG: hypothetical protein A3F46_02790 [Legionellales bacterium RIFCSPHIGHO2_12_FULL_42_9]|nr:MAG: hypothetical protein A3F46_02790 [Legionellales bacterium RIFCSPHIGHO2_12_FULL_42_9]